VCSAKAVEASAVSLLIQAALFGKIR